MSQQGAPQAYPVKTRKTRRSTQSWWLLVLRDPQGQLWLQRRPVQAGETGIWAGLFSPPVFASDAQPAQGSLDRFSHQIEHDAQMESDTRVPSVESLVGENRS